YTTLFRSPSCSVPEILLQYKPEFHDVHHPDPKLSQPVLSVPFSLPEYPAALWLYLDFPVPDTSGYWPLRLYISPSDLPHGSFWRLLPESFLKYPAGCLPAPALSESV